MSEREISDGFWIGVECIAGIVIIIAILGMWNTSRTMYSSFETQQATERRLQEARQWNAYDGKQVYSADVISLYNRYPKGELPESINLQVDGSHTYNLKDLTPTQVDQIVTAGYYYNCTIHKNDITRLVDRVDIVRTTTPI